MVISSGPPPVDVGTPPLHPAAPAPDRKAAKTQSPTAELICLFLKKFVGLFTLQPHNQERKYKLYSTEQKLLMFI